MRYLLLISISFLHGVLYSEEGRPADLPIDAQAAVNSFMNKCIKLSDEFNGNLIKEEKDVIAVLTHLESDAQKNGDTKGASAIEDQIKIIQDKLPFEPKDGDKTAKLSELILGKWTVTRNGGDGHPGIWEFSNDGTVKIKELNGLGSSGTWSEQWDAQHEKKVLRVHWNPSKTTEGTGGLLEEIASVSDHVFIGTGWLCGMNGLIGERLK